MEDPEHTADDGPAESEDRPAKRFREGARRTDSNPQLVATAKFLRRLLPGDQRYGDALSTAGGELPQRLGRSLSEAQAERPSAMREFGLGVLQAWDALSEDKRRGKEVDVAILFTDLVGFSSWALEAGDDAALRMLREVGAAEEAAITGNGGILVKRLGDGAMAVFEDANGAVKAAFELQGRLAGIEVEGQTPRVRAGIHLGRPQRIGGDFLGVDVNVAARVGEAAKGGEVLVSRTAREALDEGAFRFGRERRLRASGAPSDLHVSRVKSLA